jgi:hypothetical protein
MTQERGQLNVGGNDFGKKDTDFQQIGSEEAPVEILTGSGGGDRVLVGLDGIPLLDVLENCKEQGTIGSFNDKAIRLNNEAVRIADLPNIIVRPGDKIFIANQARGGF